MGNEIDLGEGLDDLDFGGAAAAQLNVGVPEREPDDDVPWPTGRTPEGAELALDRKEAEQIAGFGPTPNGLLQTPIYALRVFRALPKLRDAVAEAERQLAEAEDRRDEKLAALALQKRAELEHKDRFSSLYSALGRHEENIALKKRQLELADVEGAQALRDAQAQIETGGAERAEKEKLRDEKRVVVEHAERNVKRFQAAQQRVQIEWRNIEARAARTPGTEMPADLDAQLDVLEQQRSQIKQDLSYAIGQYKDLKRALSAAEDDLRVAAAEVRRAEGEKEGLLMAYEGDIAQKSRALDEALFEKQQELARAARAILDLRGEVPVPGAVRSKLLAADREVVDAARHLETTRLALGSMDVDAYGTGRAAWVMAFVALAVVVMVLLLAL